MTIFPVLYNIYNTALSPGNDLIIQADLGFFFYVSLLCDKPLKPPFSFLFSCSINFQGIVSLILEIFHEKQCSRIPSSESSVKPACSSQPLFLIRNKPIYFTFINFSVQRSCSALYT